MEYIIDRIEDGIAVIESKSGEVIELPKNALPKSAREGQCLIKEGDGYIIDKAATEKRRAEMRSRLDKILGKK